MRFWRSAFRDRETHSTACCAVLAALIAGVLLAACNQPPTGGPARQNEAPRGYVDVPAEGAQLPPRTGVAGWALDDRGVREIRVLVDGRLAKTATLTAERPDVTKAYPQYSRGTNRHGWTADIEFSSPGPHTLIVQAVDSDGATRDIGVLNVVSGGNDAPPPPGPRTRKELAALRASSGIRRELLQELTPIRLANCEFQRFGEPYDGGYVMCGNLLGGVASGYSYGISGYDGWGCDISRKFKIPVHQYDCFNLTEPSCPGGTTVFHAECVAGSRFTDKAGRLFDRFDRQFVRNGDGKRRVVMKIDVEGAEWESFLKASAATLDRIDQIATEMHGVNERRYLAAVKKLKQHFYVAYLHFNNHTCDDAMSPFPAEVYEVLFVNKRLGVPDSSGKAWTPHPAATRNHPWWPDCQTFPR